MPDRDDSSPTGEFPRFEGEPPREEREPKPPKTLPEVSGDYTGSTTGVMRIHREGQDDSAKRDEDQPA
jgi:hypothetical protein